MKVNPNLRNPLALFALCFLLIESIVIALLMTKGGEITFSTWTINMFAVFIVAFPGVVFICFYILLLCKPETLFSPYENAMAFRIISMSKREVKEAQWGKNVNYGSWLAQSDKTQATKKSIKEKTEITEDILLDQFIAQIMPFMRKRIKVMTLNGACFFDGYAYLNGCNYVVEVNRLAKWTDACKHGIDLFVSNARNCFSSLHMTVVLYIEDANSQYEEIANEIHKIDPAINILFANASTDDNVIKFSNIY